MKKNILSVLAIVLLHAGIAQAQDAAPDQLRPALWRERFTSPRIEALRKEIASDRATTEAFWSEVAKEGTPLIEPSNGRDKHQLVTFLWRGTSETRSVLVVYRVSVDDQAGPGFFGDLELDAAVADPLNRNNWLGHSEVLGPHM